MSIQVSRSRLLIWAVALGVGSLLGYFIAVGLAQTGLGSLEAVVAGVLAVAILIVLGLVAAVLALARDKSGHAVARTAVVAGLLLLAGVIAGRVLTPVLWPEYREPLVLEARGTATLTGTFSWACDAWDGGGAYSISRRS